MKKATRGTREKDTLVLTAHEGVDRVEVEGFMAMRCFAVQIRRGLFKLKHIPYEEEAKRRKMEEEEDDGGGWKRRVAKGGRQGGKRGWRRWWRWWWRRMRKRRTLTM